MKRWSYEQEKAVGKVVKRQEGWLFAEVVENAEEINEIIPLTNPCAECCNGT